MAKFKVVLRTGQPVDIESDDVHVTPQGNVKFLNGKKADATLVAFFNASDVVSVIKQ